MQIVRLSSAAIFYFVTLAASATAAPLTLTYDTFLESKTVGEPLSSATPIRMDGMIADALGSVLDNTLIFKAGSTSLSLAAGWLTAPTSLRMVGVNIDLLDGANNVIGTDSFAGVVGTLAQSTLTAGGLTPGAQYKIKLTGTALEAGRYQIDLVDGTSVPAIPSTPPVVPPSGILRFDTHVGEKANGPKITPGTALQIDGDMRDDMISAIQNAATFTVTSDTLSAGIVWIVSPGAQRTVGVNVDLVDAANTVVATDLFVNVTDGQAFSQLVATGLAPGEYRLIFTGTAVEGSRYHINLTTDTTAPDFAPIIDSPSTGVPEPASLALLMTGLLLLSARRSFEFR